MTTEQTMMMIAKDVDINIATKTIGLISDTHIPSRATALPKEIFTIFQNVDYIIHAGDLVELSVIDELEQIAPVLAVHGNMDTPETKNALPELNSLKILDKKIGVIHNPNIIYGLEHMRELAKTNNFDIIVYGHTHNANIKWEEQTLYINPGSPTSPSSLLNKPSVALLKITKDKITPEITPF
ncbi:MAG: metallophosphoesterase [Candidatus Bathyarchaeota archaeon]|nr:metallophosphoesterase [Candidatus Termiticorpusculum sp.]MCL1970463.1 metallophosphoesterase [Candidatus Termiticorpusculum sp.]